MRKYKTPLELMTEWKDELQHELTAERENRKRELEEIKLLVGMIYGLTTTIEPDDDPWVPMGKDMHTKAMELIESKINALDTKQEKE